MALQSGKEALQSVVLSCFSAILSGNQQQMKDAEEELKALQVTEDFGLVLAEITVAPDGPVAYRQLASVILKQYVKNHWAVLEELDETQTSSKVIEPVPGEDTKMGIRQILLRGLGDPLSKIRATVAYAISAIAYTDWPENWPDLFDQLMAGLGSGSPELVHGTMRVLTEFSLEITDTQIPLVAPVILPQLLRVIAEPQLYSVRTRSRAVNIFMTLTRLIHTVTSLVPNVAQSFLFPYLPSFVDSFIQILNSSNECNTDPGLRKEIIISLAKLIECFPGVLRPHLMAIVTPVWNILLKSVDLYVRSIVNSSDSSVDVYDSDGEIINFDSVLLAVFQFITSVLEYGHQPNIFPPILPDLVHHLITLMQITAEQVSRWEPDPNMYLDEDDSEYSFSVRLLAYDLLTQLLEDRTLNIIVYQAICSAIEKHLTHNPRDVHTQWWKIHEACFLVVGGTIVDNNKTNPVNFGSQVFVENVLLPDLSASVSPILTGRCIWLAGKISSHIGPQTIQSCLESTLSGLQITQHMIIRIMSAKAVYYFCTQLKEENHRSVLSHFLPYFISHLCDMASDSHDVMLFTVLDCLQQLFQVDYSITASHSERIVPLTLSLFLKYSLDPAVSSCLEDVFLCLANNPGCQPLLHSRLLPTAIEILSASDTQIPLGMVSSTLEILVIIIRGCDPPLPPSFVNELFSVVVQRVLMSEDPAILQSGGECIRAFLSKASDQLVEWSDSTGQTGLHYATQVVMNLLDPARPEYSAAFVDKLIIVFVKKVGNALGSYLELLLRSVLSKMQQVKTPSIMQSLLIVFAHLASTEQLEGLISFLSQVPDPSGRPALEYVVTEWCMRHSYFFGHYEQRVSTVALCQLLSHCLNTGDQRLNNILVVEEEAPNHTEGVLTRSKKASSGDRWTQTPLPVKLMKVLIAELRSQIEEEEEDDNDEDDEEDDTWSSDVQVGDMVNSLEELFHNGMGVDQEEDEDDDPDLKDEALLKINLHSHLVQYFVELCHHSCFQSLLPHLSAYEKQLLNTVGALTI